MKACDLAGEGISVYAIKKMAAGRGYRRSGFGQSRENPLPARAQIGGLPDLRQCWSERMAFLQQPKHVE